jgi:hypothetical protein
MISYLEQNSVLTRRKKTAYLEQNHWLPGAERLATRRKKTTYPEQDYCLLDHLPGAERLATRSKMTTYLAQKDYLPGGLCSLGYRRKTNGFTDSQDFGHRRSEMSNTNLLENALKNY